MDFRQPNSPLGGLARVKTNRSRRSWSYDRTGGNRDLEVVAPGETFVMVDIEGAGRIEHGLWEE